jgi:hypothetical protein
VELQASYTEVCHKLREKLVIEIDIFGKMEHHELDNNSISHQFLKSVLKQRKLSQNFIFLCTAGGGKWLE